MDTTTPPTVTVKTDDPDHYIQPDNTQIPHQPRPPFTNGTPKKHKPQQQHQQLQNLQYHPHNNNNLVHPVLVMKYKECLKNHAANIGKHAVDGCCEFMPSLTSLPTDPTSLTCAACGCHRNFHRREPDAPFPFLHNPPSVHHHHLIEYQPHHRHHPPPPPPPPPVSVAGVKEIKETSQSPVESQSPPPISSSYYHPSAPHMLLALKTGSPANRVKGKKRFRTIFSEEQKVKMREMAERVGWRMQKKDEGVIVGFCNEVGVDKGVFRIWMHNNNKVTLGGKKDSGSGSSGGEFLMNKEWRRPNDGIEGVPNDGSFSSGGGGDGDGDGGGNVVGSSSSS